MTTVQDYTADLSTEPTKASELARIPIFSDLPAEQLEWLASQMRTATLQGDEIFIRPGTPAEYMTVILDGELRAITVDTTRSVFIGRAGDVTGMLPYSRLTTFTLSVRSFGFTRLALLHKDFFPEMLYRMPILGQRLVAIMSDRIREITKMDVQREKMMALGKLSAGLAHELNNPAAAARRAAESLKQAVQSLRAANIRLSEYELTHEQRAMLVCVEREMTEQPHWPVLDALDRSDREEALAGWLEKHNVARGWELASSLVEAGFDLPCMEEVASEFPDDILEPGLTMLTAAVTVDRLAGEIANATGRIGDLVSAIKEYSYMDQMPEQEVDVHRGIENTLTMLQHRLKHGISIRREYAPNLPTVCARGSELNQVWTNLIENAADAMNDNGTLTIRTRLESSVVAVAIIDTGCGIPEEFKDRIFEPFFTTKNVGEGTGLGLDLVYRIVRQHRGTVDFESVPGRTSFEVRIPASVQAA